MEYTNQIAVDIDKKFYRNLFTKGKGPRTAINQNRTTQNVKKRYYLFITTRTKAMEKFFQLWFFCTSTGRWLVAKPQT